MALMSTIFHLLMICIRTTYLLLSLNPTPHVQHSQWISIHSNCSRHYNENLEEWCANNEGDPLPKSAFFSVFQPAWERAMTPHNIRAGFWVTGIYPINPRAIPPEKFVTSSKCQELVKVQLYSVFNSLIH